MSDDAREGDSAIAASMPSGQSGFVSYSFPDTGQDISNRRSLSFWWKTEGDGLRDLKIKVRNHPLADGAEVVYQIWSGSEPPEGWQLAMVDLAKPIDRWGDPTPQPNRRYITFRAAIAQDSNARLFIDHIVAMDRTFSWKVQAPRQEEAPAPSSDPETGHASWYFPIEFENHAAQPLWISVGSEGQTFATQIIRPGTNQVRVPIPPDQLGGGEETGRIPLWAQVTDYSHTRSEWISHLRQGGLSRTWEQFVLAKETGTEPILPDFSYAGYRYFGEPIPDPTHPVFDVTRYGAIPDDDLSDQSAIVRAIAAAEANGSGIVYFPPGEFLVNTEADTDESGSYAPIHISSSRIVLKGSGSRLGGTIIRQVDHMLPADEDLLYSSPYMFHFKPSTTRSRTLATITESAGRETFWLTVADSSRLRVGQRVTIFMRGTAAIDDFLAPHSPTTLGTKLRTEGIEVGEEHSIAEIQGNRIRLNEPLHANVNPEHGWTVHSYPHLEEVGVEDISFHGSFLENFVHHKNAIHDGGWSMLKFNRCVNSWMRRVSFVNTSRAVSILGSAAVSVYHVTLGGNMGHVAINSQGSYGVWVGLSEDLAGHLHGIGMSHSATGTVFWRVDMSPKQSLDIHKTKPSYSNLYDQVANGRLYGSSGGGIPPHHLRHLVFWNFDHGGDDTYYDFWQGYLRFLDPIVVGFRGNPASFNDSNLEVFESNGTAVEPASLFEAQLEARLRIVPSWIDNLELEWKTLRKMPLPEFPVPDFVGARPE